MLEIMYKVINRVHLTNRKCCRQHVLGFPRSLKFFGRRWRIFSCLPHIPLLNGESMIASPFHQKKVFLSGVTAAKTHWFQGENLLTHSYTSGFFFSFLYV